MRIKPPTSRSGVRRSTTRPPRLTKSNGARSIEYRACCILPYLFFSSTPASSSAYLFCHLYTLLCCTCIVPLYMNLNVSTGIIFADTQNLMALWMSFQSRSFLAHLSRRLIGELVGYPWYGVRRRSQCSKIFFSETAWPIKAKFYVEPPWEEGTKVYINGPGHMTKMAAVPIYGKNLKKSSSPEPAGRFSRNLVCSIGDSCPS